MKLDQRYFNHHRPSVVVPNYSLCISYGWLVDRCGPSEYGRRTAVRSRRTRIRSIQSVATQQELPETFILDFAAERKSPIGTNDISVENQD